MKFVKEKLGRISIVLLFIVFGLVLKTAIHSPVPKHFEENVKIIDNSGADITLIETTGILSEIEEVMEQGPVEEDGPPAQFSTLQAVNPDIVGWIRIAGTQIDYPIVQKRLITTNICIQGLMEKKMYLAAFFWIMKARAILLEKTQCYMDII